MVRARVLILGGGVGGTLAANRLARTCPGADITLADSHGDHIFQPGILKVPFGADPSSLSRPLEDLLRPEIRLIVARAQVVDPERREVRFESGRVEPWDWLLVAPGARLDHSAFPGAKDVAHHFHCRRGAIRLREALDAFRGGRIVVGAASLPMKCPPAPAEFALRLDRLLRSRGLRRRTLLTYAYPAADVLPGANESAMMRPLLEERGIRIEAAFTEPRIDPARRVLESHGRELPFDLAVYTPPHTSATFVKSLPWIDPEGWIRTDARTLRVADRVYAVGDATNLPRPKYGAATHFQALAAAANIAAEIEGGAPSGRYDGRVLTFVATGRGKASRLEQSYLETESAKPPSILSWLQLAAFARFYFRFLRSA